MAVLRAVAPCSLADMTDVSEVFIPSTNGVITMLMETVSTSFYGPVRMRE
jgi:hypothetical protein